MNFASDEFFQYLKKEITREEADGKIYYELEIVIKQTVYKVISKKVPNEYIDDVYQDVFFSVWRNLADFIEKSDNISEAQRMSWLLTITERRIADFYAKYYKKNGILVSIDDDEKTIQIADSRNDPAENIGKNEFTKNMELILYELFRINTAPEKIISYIYSKIIFSIDDKVNSKPSYTVEYLTGKSLYWVFDDMKRELSYVLGVEIPEHIFGSLKSKLNYVDDSGKMVGERLFMSSVKKITDSNSRIQKKLENNDRMSKRV